MESLIPNTCYHIFNHANGFENVFEEPENYRFFLERYADYISPIAETYAYCLMPNHFHLVIRIRKREVIEELIRRKLSTTSNNNETIFSKVERNFGKDSYNNFGKDSSSKNELQITDVDIEKFLSKQFSNLFSSYTQSFNKYRHRRGSLFIKNFKREAILDKEHFITSILYTHRNPIHHGFRTRYDEWTHCSYQQILDGKSELVEVNKVLAIFRDKQGFLGSHQEYLENWKNMFLILDMDKD